MKYASLACSAFLMLFFFMTDALGAADGTITLVYTNSLNGNIDYCHCAGNPNGGLVKRATEIKSIRKSRPGVVLVETGDFLPPDNDPGLAAAILEGYRYIGYDGICPGDQELAAARELISHGRGLPLLCGNIIVRNSAPLKKLLGRHALLRRGGISVGLIGSIDPSAFKFYPRRVSEGFGFTDQAEEINREAAALRGLGADIVIVLSHSGYENDLVMEKKLKGVDIIVGGHSQTLLKQPVRGKRALIVQAGTDGAHIGVLELTVKNGAVESYRNAFRRPDEHRPADDPFIRRLIERYRKKVKADFKDLRF